MRKLGASMDDEVASSECRADANIGGGTVCAAVRRSARRVKGPIMTFFSRCDASHRDASTARSAVPRRVRAPDDESGLRAAIAGFAEDLGILFRYAAGLDYYGRDRSRTHR